MSRSDRVDTIFGFRAFSRVLSFLLLLIPANLVAQNVPPSPHAPPPSQTAQEGTASFSGSNGAPGPEELEALVGRIALYPDDLLAIVLPASTQPIQVVQAAQLLERRKSNPSTQPPKSWDPSVIALLNYPEVIALMNSDLDWMQQLGTAVIDQQGPLLDAIQAFRAKVQSAGNLKSDDKMTVGTQEQKIVIESSNPEVVYVPNYNPTTIVYPPQPAAPPPYYYSPPYPPYWAPGAAFFTGMFFGAAIGYGLSWNDNGIYHGDVNINNSNNINSNRNNISNREKIQHHGENKWRANESGAGRGRNNDLGGRGQASARPASDQIRRDLASRDAPGRGQFGGPGDRSQLDGAGPRPSTGAVGNRGSNFGGGAGLNQGGRAAGGSSINRPSSPPQAGAFQGSNRSAAATRSYSSRGSASMGRSGGGGSRAAAAPRGGGGGRGGRR